MIRIEVKRDQTESTGSAMRRFSKKVQVAGIVRKVKGLKAVERTLSHYKKKKAALKGQFARISKIPDFIQLKQAEEIKTALTSQVGTMRANMLYISGKLGRKDNFEPKLLHIFTTQRATHTVTMNDRTNAASFKTLSGETNSPTYAKAREFVQKISDMEISSRQKRFKDCAVEYDEATKLLDEWKTMVSF